MNWYYVEGGQQAGPVDDAQLEEMARSGKIQGDTLVWREGLTSWQSYREIKPGPTTVAGPEGAAPTAGEAVCVECGKMFAVENMIQFDNVYVCAGCKPIFVQKLAEGAKVTTARLNYASFWTRFGAVVLDGLILFGVNMIINLISGSGFGQSFGTQRPPVFGPLQVILFFCQMLIGISYEVVMIGKYGATLGKMACNIKVVTAEGARVSYLRALGRHFAKLLSAMICSIGYLMAAFDEEKRALHDRICNTRVVLK